MEMEMTYSRNFPKFPIFGCDWKWKIPQGGAPPVIKWFIILLSIDKTTISPTWSYLLELFAPT